MLLSESLPTEVTLYPNPNFTMRGWLKCDGQVLPIAQYEVIYSVLGNTYGGDAREGTFGLPKLTPPENFEYIIDMTSPWGVTPGKSQQEWQNGVIGETIYYAGQITSPPGWVPCNGQALSATNYPNLFKVIGHAFGGEGDSFNVPNIDAPADHMKVFMCAKGELPSTAAGTGLNNMPGTLGDIEFMASQEAWQKSDYWHLCDGSLLSIADYPALFSLIGTIYGGDGENNFALPKLANLQDHVYSLICISGQYPARD